MAAEYFKLGTVAVMVRI